MRKISTHIYIIFFFRDSFLIYTNLNVRKSIFGPVRPAKIQISLRIRAVWSESSLGTLRIAKDAKFPHADNEDSDRTAQMRRLIWVFEKLKCQTVRS